MLYTKSMKEYKDTAKKIDLWNSKAAELDLESGPLLKTWYESVRTKVGKLSDKKSGSATKDMTDRDHLPYAELWVPGVSHSQSEGQTFMQCEYKFTLLLSFFLSFFLHDVMIECILL